MNYIAPVIEIIAVLCMAQLIIDTLIMQSMDKLREELREWKNEIDRR